MYIFIGALLSAMLLCILLIDDFFELVANLIKRQSSFKEALPVIFGTSSVILLALFIKFLFKSVR